MSENHSVSGASVISGDLDKLLCSITNYIAESEFEDLIQRCIEENWTLDQACEHIAFMGLELEWFLYPSNHPNPRRYALAELKNSAAPEDYDKLDDSLKLIDQN